MTMTLKAGQDKSWLLTFTGDGVPYDLTGCTLDFRILDADGATIVSKSSSVGGEIDLILTGNKNTATLTLVPADSTGRGCFTGEYVIRLTTPGAKVYPAGSGAATFEEWPFDP